MRFIALESRTSPPLEANTITKMAAQSSSDFMLLLARAQTGFEWFGLGDLRAARHPADATADQQDSQPAQRRDVLVEKVSSEESDQDVSQGGCRQHITKVGPRESREVRSKECDQAGDSDQHPGIAQRGDHMPGVTNIDGSKGVHAALQQSVTDAAEAHHCQQDQILFQIHRLIPGTSLG